MKVYIRSNGQGAYHVLARGLPDEAPVKLATSEAALCGAVIAEPEFMRDSPRTLDYYARDGGLPCGYCFTPPPEPDSPWARALAKARETT